jgi:hypothetical protein
LFRGKAVQHGVNLITLEDQKFEISLSYIVKVGGKEGRKEEKKEKERTA